MKIKRLLTVVIYLIAALYSNQSLAQSLPYKQIRIPLDVQKGVPFTKDEEGISVYGFDIDSSGNFYFVGAKKAILASFSNTGTTVYRKPLGHYPGIIDIVGNKIFYFESWDFLHKMIEIDKSTGTISKDFSNSIAKGLNSHAFKSLVDAQFVNSSLRIDYTDSIELEKTKTLCFDLTGQLMPRCNCPCSADTLEYLGKLGANDVFGKFVGNGYALSMRNSSNVEVSTAVVESKFLGKPLCSITCMPQEHRKLRNNKLYMLSRDKEMALITEVDLKQIFGSK